MEVQRNYEVVAMATKYEDRRETVITVAITAGPSVEGIAPREIVFTLPTWRAKDIRLGNPYRLAFGPVNPAAVK